jgi:radical SAM superfamily enzyme YgiQ (UPF0313 family)
LSYISAVLKQAGHQTRLAILSRMLKEVNQKRLDKIINEFKPGLICLSAVSTEYPFIAEQAKYIKAKYPDVFLIVGGAHISLNPDKILDDSFDALCIGEGEFPTLELVAQLEAGQTPANIPNLWFKRSDGIDKNSPRPFIADLDVLPFPDRAMWSEWIEEGAESRYSVLLARGCPFNCTYCCNHALRKLTDGRYVRFRSPANILAEIKDIAESLSGKKEIYLEVETFGADQTWALELFAGLKNLNQTLPEPIAYGANIRITPGFDFSELFAACQAANFRFINIGLESGSDRVRREILKRYYSNDDIIKTVKLARQYGLQVALFNMVGLPTETPAEFEETIKVNRDCQPDWHMTSIFYPYPGTDLYVLCQEMNLLPPTVFKSTERVASVLDMPQFTKKQVQKYFVWFDWYVYKGYKPWYKLLLKVLATKLRTKPKLHYLYRNITKSNFVKKIKNKLKS